MRRFPVSLAAAATLAMVGASVARAVPQGTQKESLYSAQAISCETGAPRSSKTFGGVSLRTPGDEVNVTGKVVLREAAPNTTYLVELLTWGGTPTCETPVIGELKTTKKGRGSVIVTTKRKPGAVKFSIGVFNSAKSELFGSPAVELD